MAKVQERVPELRLVIVGEGYERDAILGEIRRHGAENWIELAGRVTHAELRDLYRSAWIAVSASVREGWGMTLTEAAACGTPSVATDNAGHADAVAVGRSGLLASEDPELADTMVRVLTDDELRRRLSEGALARAAELTWEQTAIHNFEVLAQDALRRRG